MCRSLSECAVESRRLRQIFDGLGDGFEELLAEGGDLLLADAFDLEHLPGVLGFGTGELAEGGVGEDDVGGDVVLLGDLHAEGAEALEEGALVGGEGSEGGGGLGAVAA